MDPGFLNNPSFLELDDAYRGLLNNNFLNVKTNSVGRTLHDLEKIGFVAIQITSFNPENSSFTIIASKGKHGPCIFSGKSAEYVGKASAALDDDNHLFLNGISKSVCDKTSQILNMYGYKELILNRSESSVAKKTEDVDDFEQSQEKLFNQLKSSKPESDRKMLFYPGPFRLLVLGDGTIVRRGKWSGVPRSMAKDLIKNDGFKDWKNLYKEGPTFFQEIYINKGSACLMEDIKPTTVGNQHHETEYSDLSAVSKQLKERLINLIKKERKYFVLIGNEAEDKLGCCPSEEVSEANTLVRAGILDALSEPVQGDACPVTLYAFKNELSSDEFGFSSKINPAFRDEVYKRLTKSAGRVMQIILKWILLAFVALSLFFAVRQCNDFQQKTTQKSLSQVLNPSENLHVQIVLFHNIKRCFQCEHMEKFTKAVLQESFHEEIQNENIRFNNVIIDDPENTEIVEQYGIFASTIVLIKYDKKSIIGSEILLDATRLYKDELAFKALLESEIHEFISKKHE